MKRILHLVTSTSIFGGGIYTYLYYKTNKNRKEYEQILEAGTLKDASRLSNESFGISWGFQADDIIMSKIDSGDYLFINFECFQCLSVSDYLKCFVDSMFRLDEQFDSIGYAYRNANGLYIFYNQFGQTKIKSYAELVSLPYLKGLTIQKSTDKSISYHKKLKQLLQNQTGTVHVENKKESAVEMANRINKYLYGEENTAVSDLRELVETQQQIQVRTQTNRMLRSL